MGGIWYRDNETYPAKGYIWKSGNGAAEQYGSIGSLDFCMRRSVDEKGNYSNQIILGAEEYKKVENGVNVVVYDKMTESVADFFGIDLDDQCAVVR